MISRRRIITQSLQKIDYQNHRDAYEEDIWFNKEKLYKVSKVGNNCANFFIYKYDIRYKKIFILQLDY